jgi:hypothetical protein
MDLMGYALLCLLVCFVEPKSIDECEERGFVFDEMEKIVRIGCHDSGLGLCGLTFELSGRHREGAWPAQRMMTLAVARAKRLAGGGPLERRVRPRWEVRPERAGVAHEAARRLRWW